MKKLLLILAAFMAMAPAFCQEPEIPRFTINYGDTVRTYSMFLPSNLKADAPLVIYTHGYGSKTRWVKALNATAEREGFAVCYPDGAPDLRNKDGWNVGYPPQASMTIVMRLISSPNAKKRSAPASTLAAKILL